MSNKFEPVIHMRNERYTVAEYGAAINRWFYVGFIAGAIVATVGALLGAYLGMMLK